MSGRKRDALSAALLTRASLAGAQGNDVGEQYSSVIFAHTEAQHAAATERIAALQALLDGKRLEGGAGFAGTRVVTQVRPAAAFYPAEEAHQRYLERKPGGYCNHFVRFKWPSSGQ